MACNGAEEYKLTSAPQRVLRLRMFGEMIGPSSAAGEEWRTIGSKWVVGEGIDGEAFLGICGKWAGQL
jgi:hypothetical protein